MTAQWVLNELTKLWVLAIVQQAQAAARIARLLDETKDA